MIISRKRLDALVFLSFDLLGCNYSHKWEGQWQSTLRGVYWYMRCNPWNLPVVSSWLIHLLAVCGRSFWGVGLRLLGALVVVWTIHIYSYRLFGLRRQETNAQMDVSSILCNRGFTRRSIRVMRISRKIGESAETELARNMPREPVMLYPWRYLKLWHPSWLTWLESGWNRRSSTFTGSKVR